MVAAVVVTPAAAPAVLVADMAAVTPKVAAKPAAMDALQAVAMVVRVAVTLATARVVAILNGACTECRITSAASISARKDHRQLRLLIPITPPAARAIILRAIR
jgi:hypothetical protein